MNIGGKETAPVSRNYTILTSLWNKGNGEQSLHWHRFYNLLTRNWKTWKGPSYTTLHIKYNFHVSMCFEIKRSHGDDY
jgi:hypothetical protein